MGEVVNLRRARKTRARTDAQAAADANRALHGRTRAEREVTDADTARRNRTLDNARRDD